MLDKSSVLSWFAALIVALLFFSLLPDKGHIYPHLINSGHSFVFFFANYFLIVFLFGRSASAKHIFGISVLSVVVGILIELIQPIFGRNQSLVDVYYDLLGVSASALSYRCKQRRKRITLLLLFLIFTFSIPAYHWWVDWQIQGSPVLLNFDREWEKGVYSTINGTRVEVVSWPESRDVENGKAARLTFDSTETYPGFVLRHVKSNWIGYNNLSWQIYSPEERSVKLGLRIQDRFHNNEYDDRFNFSMLVKPGVNTYFMPLLKIKHAPQARQISLSDIDKIQFFMYLPDKDYQLYLDDLKLN